jgi:hypothetical protein
MYIHTHTYMHTYIHTHTHTCMHAYIHIYIHTHTHTYTQSFHYTKYLTNFIYSYMPEIVRYKVPTMATMKVNRLLGYAPTATTEPRPSYSCLKLFKEPH